MGTGIIAILIHDFPYNTLCLYWLSVVIFAINAVLFVSFLAMSLARYFFWSGTWTTMTHQCDQIVFLAAFPMSLGTIVIMICFVCVDTWRPRAQYLALALWGIEVMCSIMCAFFLPFILMSMKGDMALSNVTACHLFPAMSCVVASASGSVVAGMLTNPQHALCTILISYVLWGLGVPMATMVLVVYFHRLLIHKLPPRKIMVSVFIPIGSLSCY
jgi:tellurite resistance protein TehA-like permease